MPIPDGWSPAQRAQFQQLRERFVSGLPQRWLAIQQAPGKLEQAHLLHQLTGAAGAYGEMPLSQTAREAEQLLLKEAPPADMDQALANLDAQIQGLITSLSPNPLPVAQNPVQTGQVSHSHDT